jgi:hypothetical protein
MGLLTHLVIFIPAIILCFYFYKQSIQSIRIYLQNFTKNKFYWLFCTLFLAVILIQVVKKPFGYDAGLYHAQTIQWFANYKVIFGLGNLHGNLAFNSNFHLLAAFFSFSFLKIHSFQQVLGSYMILLFSLHCLARANQYDKAYRLFYLGNLLFIFIYFRDWINTPSPDIAATIYTLLIFSILLEKAVKNILHELDSNYAILIFLSIALLAVKLSAICVVFTLLFIAIYCKWNIKHFYFASSIGLLCLTPWLIRNVILSGYLIYPFPAIDIFDVDWKLPLTYALEDKAEVYYFTRYNALYPRFVYMDEAHIQSILPKSWFPIWFTDLWWINKVLFAFLCMALLIIPVVITFAKKKKILLTESKNIFLIWLCAWIGIIFWFVNAPDFRFGYGFIFTIVLLSIGLFLQLLAPIFTKYVFIGFYAICSIFLIHSIRLEYSEYPTMSQFAILPEEYPHIATRKEQIGNLMLYVPLSDFLCNTEPLPCTPFPNPKLERRGNTIEEGFRIGK